MKWAFVWWNWIEIMNIFSSGVLSRSEELFLLYKHQWNVKWAFPLTREDKMLCSHVKRSPSLWLHNKSRLWKQAVWYFSGVYIRNRILHTHLWIWILSSLVQIDISLTRYRVDHSKIKFISMREHVISSIYYRILLKGQIINDY